MSNETMRTEPETAKLIPSRFFGSRLVFTKADIRIDCIVFIKKLLLLVSFKNRQRPLSGFEARTTQSRFSKKNDSKYDKLHVGFWHKPFRDPNYDKGYWLYLTFNILLKISVGFLQLRYYSSYDSELLTAYGWKASIRFSEKKTILRKLSLVLFWNSCDDI